jgi:NAD(P)-dependent dehydrogenase (short-subunit alcohol dehydrogenase family)
MKVVITGASQGIGAAIAEAFAQEPGAQLALLARTAPRLEEVAARCSSLGASASCHSCDVTRDQDVHDVAREILGTLGAPDVLINNAGNYEPGTVADTPPDAFRRAIETNLTSAFVVTRAFLPAMVEAGRGHVFFTASVASLRAYPGVGYTAAKHGLLGLARSVREEVKELGVRVTTVFPGATLTPAWDGVAVPPERLMPASDIGRTVADIYRLSDRTVVEEIVLRPQLGDV